MLLLLNIRTFVALIPSFLFCALIFRRIIKRSLFKKGRYRIRNELAARILFSIVPLAVYSYSVNKELLSLVFYTALPLLPLSELIISRAMRRPRQIRFCNIDLKDDEKLRPLSFRLISDWHFIFLLTAFLMSIVGFSLAVALALLSIEFLILLLAVYKVYSRLTSRFDISTEINRKIIEHAPKFAIYFSAPRNTEYQLQMWIEYLDRIGLPYIIITRHSHSLNKLSEITTQPVIFCPRITDLDPILTDNITTCFYVNNSMHNSHMVRYNHITHIQLLHGDSDKASSYNPVTAMFNKVFVAGQAAIDRYINNDVHIPLEKFEIVGRPQVERVEKAKTAQVDTVLYAPTWHGNYQDTNYCSLPIALNIIESLIAKGKNIIFRPHPYSYKHAYYRDFIEQIQSLLKADMNSSGRKHLWGKEAEVEYSIFDCFNASDAMISDVSSIVPDYLFSEKPFAITEMYGASSNFEKEFPLAQVGYVLKKDLSNLENVIDEILIKDNKKEKRKKARVYYLGPFNEHNYAENFVRKSQEIICGNNGFSVSEKKIA